MTTGKKITGDITPSTRGLSDDEIGKPFPKTIIVPLEQDPIDEVVSPDIESDEPPQSPANGFVAVIDSTSQALTYKNADGTQTIYSGGSRAWRNNNPGNMRYGETARNHGAIGKDYSGFAVFSTYVAGKNAAYDLLFNKTAPYYNLTLAETIFMYAPPNDNNDSKSYLNFVSKSAKISKDTYIKDLTPTQRDGLMKAIFNMEGYQSGEIHNR